MPDLFSSRFMPCTECGASVDRFAAVAHRCSPDRSVDYRMFALREDIAQFEPRLQEYLDTARGRFETWLAARTVRGEPGAT